MRFISVDIHSVCSSVQYYWLWYVYCKQIWLISRSIDSTEKLIVTQLAHRWNWKTVHYYLHSISPQDHLLFHESAHILSAFSFKILGYVLILHSHISLYFPRSLFLQILQLKLCIIFSAPRTYYKLRVPHLPRFYPINIFSVAQIMKLFLISLHPTVTFLSFGVKHSPQNPALKYLTAMIFTSGWWEAK